MGKYVYISYYDHRQIRNVDRNKKKFISIWFICDTQEYWIIYYMLFIYYLVLIHTKLFNENKDNSAVFISKTSKAIDWDEINFMFTLKISSLNEIDANTILYKYVNICKLVPLFSCNFCSHFY